MPPTLSRRNPQAGGGIVALALLGPPRWQGLGSNLRFMEECLPDARPVRYFSINYPNFIPRFTLSWRSLPSGPRCTTHLPYKARCIIRQ